ncbi:PIK3R4 kinase-related protein (incomplete catalytic triad) [Neospora caninum Liverpool]|uniref:non-specific serine/threonine protein kinase n=1 Tax=Neospora caninum (strain Liverpool) TaxID=572307 RepID=F0VDL8_NEOCL|nr:PIK3R4 kinase-related protein (incomplete catalytic triad) [Neospora caninum Liverpool]CBZ51811.1 PIK3R4 kinase-related protein (incomplete catalytic triad) [Neospora caninum Liverpool]|eukprot:XP_003881844.1 PIK3R4 kinase-related protein (incomplete catalytic triad) [Neospora caninum Liverpool]
METTVSHRLAAKNWTRTHEIQADTGEKASNRGKDDEKKEEKKEPRKGRTVSDPFVVTQLPLSPADPEKAFALSSSSASLPSPASSSSPSSSCAAPSSPFLPPPASRLPSLQEGASEGHSLADCRCSPGSHNPAPGRDAEKLETRVPSESDGEKPRTQIAVGTRDSERESAHAGHSRISPEEQAGARAGGKASSVNRRRENRAVPLTHAPCVSFFVEDESEKALGGWPGCRSFVVSLAALLEEIRHAAAFLSSVFAPAIRKSWTSKTTETAPRHSQQPPEPLTSSFSPSSSPSSSSPSSSYRSSSYPSSSFPSASSSTPSSSLFPSSPSASLGPLWIQRRGASVPARSGEAVAGLVFVSLLRWVAECFLLHLAGAFSPPASQAERNSAEDGSDDERREEGGSQGRTVEDEASEANEGFSSVHVLVVLLLSLMIQQSPKRVSLLFFECWVERLRQDPAQWKDAALLPLLLTFLHPVQSLCVSLARTSGTFLEALLASTQARVFARVGAQLVAVHDKLRETLLSPLPSSSSLRAPSPEASLHGNDSAQREGSVDKGQIDPALLSGRGLQCGEAQSRKEDAQVQNRGGSASREARRRRGDVYRLCATQRALAAALDILCCYISSRYVSRLEALCVLPGVASLRPRSTAPAGVLPVWCALRAKAPQRRSPRDCLHVISDLRGPQGLGVSVSPRGRDLDGALRLVEAVKKALPVALAVELLHTARGLHAERPEGALDEIAPDDRQTAGSEILAPTQDGGALAFQALANAEVRSCAWSCVSLYNRIRAVLSQAAFAALRRERLANLSPTEAEEKACRGRGEETNQHEDVEERKSPGGRGRWEKRPDADRRVGKDPSDAEDAVLRSLAASPCHVCHAFRLLQLFELLPSRPKKQTRFPASRGSATPPAEPQTTPPSRRGAATLDRAYSQSSPVSAEPAGKQREGREERESRRATEAEAGREARAAEHEQRKETRDTREWIRRRKGEAQTSTSCRRSPGSREASQGGSSVVCLDGGAGEKREREGEGLEGREIKKAALASLISRLFQSHLAGPPPCACALETNSERSCPARLSLRSLAPPSASAARGPWLSPDVAPGRLVDCLFRAQSSSLEFVGALLEVLADACGAEKRRRNHAVARRDADAEVRKETQTAESSTSAAAAPALLALAEPVDVRPDGVREGRRRRETASRTTEWQGNATEIPISYSSVSGDNGFGQPRKRHRGETPEDPTTADEGETEAEEGSEGNQEEAELLEKEGSPGCLGSERRAFWSPQVERDQAYLRHCVAPALLDWLGFFFAPPSGVFHRLLPALHTSLFACFSRSLQAHKEEANGRRTPELSRGFESVLTESERPNSFLPEDVPPSFSSPSLSSCSPRVAISASSRPSSLVSGDGARSPSPPLPSHASNTAAPYPHASSTQVASPPLPSPSLGWGLSRPCASSASRPTWGRVAAKFCPFQGDPTCPSDWVANSGGRGERGEAARREEPRVAGGRGADDEMQCVDEMAKRREDKDDEEGRAQTRNASVCFFSSVSRAQETKTRQRLAALLLRLLNVERDLLALPPSLAHFSGTVLSSFVDAHYFHFLLAYCSPFASSRTVDGELNAKTKSCSQEKETDRDSMAETVFLLCELHLHALVRVAARRSRAATKRLQQFRVFDFLSVHLLSPSADASPCISAARAPAVRVSSRRRFAGRSREGRAAASRLASPALASDGRKRGRVREKKAGKNSKDGASEEQAEGCEHGDTNRDGVEARDGRRRNGPEQGDSPERSGGEAGSRGVSVSLSLRRAVLSTRSSRTSPVPWPSHSRPASGVSLPCFTPTAACKPDSPLSLAATTVSPLSLAAPAVSFRAPETRVWRRDPLTKPEDGPAPQFAASPKGCLSPARRTASWAPTTAAEAASSGRLGNAGRVAFPDGREPRAGDSKWRGGSPEAQGRKGSQAKTHGRKAAKRKEERRHEPGQRREGDGESVRRRSVSSGASCHKPRNKDRKRKREKRRLAASPTRLSPGGRSGEPLPSGRLMRPFIPPLRLDALPPPASYRDLQPPSEAGMVSYGPTSRPATAKAVSSRSRLRPTVSSRRARRASRRSGPEAEGRRPDQARGKGAEKAGREGRDSQGAEEKGSEGEQKCAQEWQTQQVGRDAEGRETHAEDERRERPSPGERRTARHRGGQDPEDAGLPLASDGVASFSRSRSVGEKRSLSPPEPRRPSLSSAAPLRSAESASASPRLPSPPSNPSCELGRNAEESPEVSDSRKESGMKRSGPHGSVAPPPAAIPPERPVFVRPVDAAPCEDALDPAKDSEREKETPESPTVSASSSRLCLAANPRFLSASSPASDSPWPAPAGGEPGVSSRWRQSCGAAGGQRRAPQRGAKREHPIPGLVLSPVSSSTSLAANGLGPLSLGSRNGASQLHFHPSPAPSGSALLDACRRGRETSDGLGLLSRGRAVGVALQEAPTTVYPPQRWSFTRRPSASLSYPSSFSAEKGGSSACPYNLLRRFASETGSFASQSNRQPSRGHVQAASAVPRPCRRRRRFPDCLSLQRDHTASSTALLSRKSVPSVGRGETAPKAEAAGWWWRPRSRPAYHCGGHSPRANGAEVEPETGEAGDCKGENTRMQDGTAGTGTGSGGSGETPRGEAPIGEAQMPSASETGKETGMHAEICVARTLSHTDSLPSFRPTRDAFFWKVPEAASAGPAIRSLASPPTVSPRVCLPGGDRRTPGRALRYTTTDAEEKVRDREDVDRKETSKGAGDVPALSPTGAARHKPPFFPETDLVGNAGLSPQAPSGPPGPSVEPQKSVPSPGGASSNRGRDVALPASSRCSLASLPGSSGVRSSCLALPLTSAAEVPGSPWRRPSHLVKLSAFCSPRPAAGGCLTRPRQRAFSWQPHPFEKLCLLAALVTPRIRGREQLQSGSTNSLKEGAVPSSSASPSSSCCPSSGSSHSSSSLSSSSASLFAEPESNDRAASGKAGRGASPPGETREGGGDGAQIGDAASRLCEREEGDGSEGDAAPDGELGAERRESRSAIPCWVAEPPALVVRPSAQSEEEGTPEDQQVETTAKRLSVSLVPPLLFPWGLSPGLVSTASRVAPGLLVVWEEARFLLREGDREEAKARANVEWVERNVNERWLSRNTRQASCPAYFASLSPGPSVPLPYPEEPSSPAPCARPLSFASLSSASAAAASGSPLFADLSVAGVSPSVSFGFEANGDRSQGEPQRDRTHPGDPGAPSLETLITGAMAAQSEQRLCREGRLHAVAVVLIVALLIQEKRGLLSSDGREGLDALVSPPSTRYDRLSSPSFPSRRDNTGSATPDLLRTARRTGGHSGEEREAQRRSEVESREEDTRRGGVSTRSGDSCEEKKEDQRKERQEGSTGDCLCSGALIPSTSPSPSPSRGSTLCASTPDSPAQGTPGGCTLGFARLLPLLQNHLSFASRVARNRRGTRAVSGERGRWKAADGERRATRGMYGSVWKCATAFPEVPFVAVKRVSAPIDEKSHLIFSSTFHEVVCLDAFRLATPLLSELFDFGLSACDGLLTYTINMKLYGSTLGEWRRGIFAQCSSQPWFALLEGRRREQEREEEEQGREEEESVEFQRAFLPLLLGIFRQIACAVAALHARGILHCDLKCDNVLVDFSTLLPIPRQPLAPLPSRPRRRSLAEKEEEETERGRGDRCESFLSLHAQDAGGGAEKRGLYENEGAPESGRTIAHAKNPKHGECDGLSGENGRHVVGEANCGRSPPVACWPSSSPEKTPVFSRSSWEREEGEEDSPVLTPVVLSHGVLLMPQVALSDFGEACVLAKKWEQPKTRSRGTEVNKSPELLHVVVLAEDSAEASECGCASFPETPRESGGAAGGRAEEGAKGERLRPTRQRRVRLSEREAKRASPETKQPDTQKQASRGAPDLPSSLPESGLYGSHSPALRAANKGDDDSSNPVLCSLAPALPSRLRLASSAMAADVWALGCLFFELVTGHFLFASNPCFYLRLSGRLPLLDGFARERLDAVHPLLVPFLRRLLRRDAARRPSASQVVSLVDALLLAVFHWRGTDSGGVTSEKARKTQGERRSKAERTPAKQPRRRSQRRHTGGVRGEKGTAGTGHEEREREGQGEAQDVEEREESDGEAREDVKRGTKQKQSWGVQTGARDACEDGRCDARAEWNETYLSLAGCRFYLGMSPSPVRGAGITQEATQTPQRRADTAGSKNDRHAKDEEMESIPEVTRHAGTHSLVDSSGFSRNVSQTTTQTRREATQEASCISLRVAGTHERETDRSRFSGGDCDASDADPGTESEGEQETGDWFREQELDRGALFSCGDFWAFDAPGRSGCMLRVLRDVEIWMLPGDSSCRKTFSAPKSSVASPSFLAPRIASSLLSGDAGWRAQAPRLNRFLSRFSFIVDCRKPLRLPRKGQRTQMHTCAVLPSRPPSPSRSARSVALSPRFLGLGEAEASADPPAVKGWKTENTARHQVCRCSRFTSRSLPPSVSGWRRVLSFSAFCLSGGWSAASDEEGERGDERPGAGGTAGSKEGRQMGRKDSGSLGTGNASYRFPEDRFSAVVGQEGGEPCVRNNSARVLDFKAKARTENELRKGGKKRKLGTRPWLRRDKAFAAFLPALFDFLREAAACGARVLLVDEEGPLRPGDDTEGFGELREESEAETQESVSIACAIALVMEGLSLDPFRAANLLSSQCIYTSLTAATRNVLSTLFRERLRTAKRPTFFFHAGPREGTRVGSPLLAKKQRDASAFSQTKAEKRMNGVRPLDDVAADRETAGSRHCFQKNRRDRRMNTGLNDAFARPSTLRDRSNPASWVCSVFPRMREMGQDRREETDGRKGKVQTSAGETEALFVSSLSCLCGSCVWRPTARSFADLCFLSQKGDNLVTGSSCVASPSSFSTGSHFAFAFSSFGQPFSICQASACCSWNGVPGGGAQDAEARRCLSQLSGSKVEERREGRREDRATGESWICCCRMCPLRGLCSVYTVHIRAAYGLSGLAGISWRLLFLFPRAEAPRGGEEVQRKRSKQEGQRRDLNVNASIFSLLHLLAGGRTGQLECTYSGLQDLTEGPIANAEEVSLSQLLHRPVASSSLGCFSSPGCGCLGAGDCREGQTEARRKNERQGQEDGSGAETTARDEQGDEKEQRVASDHAFAPGNCDTVRHVQWKYFRCRNCHLLSFALGFPSSGCVTQGRGEETEAEDEGRYERSRTFEAETDTEGSEKDARETGDLEQSRDRRFQNRQQSAAPATAQRREKRDRFRLCAILAFPVHHSGRQRSGGLQVVGEAREMPGEIRSGVEREWCAEDAGRVCLPTCCIEADEEEGESKDEASTTGGDSGRTGASVHGGTERKWKERDLREGGHPGNQREISEEKDRLTFDARSIGRQEVQEKSPQSEKRGGLRRRKEAPHGKDRRQREEEERTSNSCCFQETHATDHGSEWSGSEASPRARRPVLTELLLSDVLFCQDWQNDRHFQNLR